MPPKNSLPALFIKSFPPRVLTPGQARKLLRCELVFSFICSTPSSKYQLLCQSVSSGLSEGLGRVTILSPLIVNKRCLQLPDVTISFGQTSDTQLDRTAVVHPNVVAMWSFGVLDWVVRLCAAILRDVWGVCYSLQTALDSFGEALQSGIHAVGHPPWRLDPTVAVAPPVVLASCLLSGFVFITPPFVCEKPILNTLPCFRNWLGKGLVIQAIDHLMDVPKCLLFLCRWGFSSLNIWFKFWSQMKRSSVQRQESKSDFR